MMDKNEIDNYSEKEKTLRENGWTDLWHPDNWVKNEWVNMNIDIDRAGFSMDSAYASIKKSDNHVDKKFITLEIPEEDLEEVIHLIRLSIYSEPTSNDVWTLLAPFCEENSKRELTPEEMMRYPYDYGLKKEISDK
jgi:hypothetical protein